MDMSCPLCNWLSPGSEASREVANLTWKNPLPPVNGVKEFVCLSVKNFDLNYLRTGKIEWAEIFFRISSSKSHILKFFVFLAGGRYGLGRGPKILIWWFSFDVTTRSHLELSFSKFGLMVIFGLMVFNLFDRMVFCHIIFIYLVLRIRSADPARLKFCLFSGMTIQNWSKWSIVFKVN